MSAWLTWQRMAQLATALFSVSVGALLVHSHDSQQKLKSSEEARLLADARQTSGLLTDFLAEQRHFVRNLADSNEIDVFLTNRALGMSMRYGLGANLYEVDSSLRRAIERRQALGSPVYSRIRYVDESGEVLADTSPGALELPPVKTSGPDPVLEIDAAHHRIIASAGVGYRGTPGGTVTTVTDLALLSRYLSSPIDDEGPRQLLIDERGRPLTASLPMALKAEPLPALATLPEGLPTPAGHLPADLPLPVQAGDLVLRTAVGNTGLSLVTLVPESRLHGPLAVRIFPYVAVAGPLLLLLVLLATHGTRQRARKLEADVLESNRDRSELKDKNDALVREVSRREALERELRESEERYRTYIEHAPEGVFVTDAEGLFIDANPSACAMVGYTREELLTMSATDLAPSGLSGKHAELHRSILGGGSQKAEINLHRKDGQVLVAELHAIALPGDRMMGFCVDITEQKQAEEQILQLAYYDPLTALPNRRLLMDRLQRAMAVSGRSQQFGALFILDLDHFKNLNDTQGHDLGDRLLIEVAKRLTSALRQEDTVARLGGDEYVMVIEGLGLDAATATRQAEAVADKVRSALAQPFILQADRPPHHSTTSIGVTLFQAHETAAELLLKQADVALYQAKNAGRNTSRFFNPDMQAAIDARAAMETALRRGIAQHELTLYCQPQVDANQCVTGAEALLRWLPPDSPPIPPLQFIPLAEETGLIVEIGEWVIEQACIWLKNWQSDATMAALCLSVNVSARQFHQPNFVDYVLDAVRRHGIDARRLTLELTESVVLDRVEDVIERMLQLKSVGIRFSIDDFGTGYSSLSYLKRLPVDEVKIDRTFIRDITLDQNDLAIVRAILAMSHSLGLSVIAEGVETGAQHALLMQHGCDGFQGYLFGRPEPVDALVARSRQDALGTITAT
ncbi:putative bifunctional diguanylate cyclase/phosphodiesterase [Methyloversatilis sp.]|uniref:putative bifunctional diguanylate cyclase/phosphodiesterase n=1 Tax=Methyloversatilis sp. TaxID=2569862 RepID=UPI003F706DB7